MYYHSGKYMVAMGGRWKLKVDPQWWWALAFMGNLAIRPVEP
jgi:hypothetical protein